MDKTVRKVTVEEMKNEEYRYWQSVSPGERIRAAFQLSIEGYRAKGISTDGRALKTTLVHFQRERS